MDNDITKKFQEQEEKLEKIYQSVEKTRKYFLWMLIASVLLIVLPLVGLLFAIPQFLSTYSNIGI